MSKFPKDNNNLQCLDKCYKKNSLVIHPFTLDYTNVLHNSCPISLLYSNETLKDKKKFMSKCSIENNRNNGEVNYFAPAINISNNFFLKYIYDFSNIIEAFKYLNENDLNEKTKIRILNSIWKKYYKKELADIFVNYYIDNYSKKTSFDIMLKIIKDFIKNNNKDFDKINNIHKKFLNNIKIK